jgi:hypothetical protein
MGLEHDGMEYAPLSFELKLVSAAENSVASIRLRPHPASY